MLNTKELEEFTLSKLYDVKDQLKQHVYGRSIIEFNKGDESRDEIEDKDSLVKRQTNMRNHLIESMGGLPSSDTPLNSKVKDTILFDGFRIEKIIYESRPKTYVTSNLYIPDGITSPRGAVLFMCGHHEDGKHNPEYQMVCQHLVRSGLVVLAIDPIGQGERLSYYEDTLGFPTVDSCTKEHDYAGSQCLPLGDGLARYFVHDGMRGIDYLCSRNEVDPKKIGVTGNSGGGTQTSLMMVCDERIAAAAPATFIMNRETYIHAGGAQDAEQIWRGMTALGFDHEDILMAMVPRPVRVLAVQYDFFPIEGTRRTVERTKRFWDLYGRSDYIDLVEDTSIHRYTEILAKAAADFFSKHLLSEQIPSTNQEIKTLSPPRLWCTSSGQVREDYKESRGVYEENFDRLEKLEKKRREYSENKIRKEALSWLHKKVMYSRKPCSFNLKIFPVGQWENIKVESMTWWSQEGILNHAFMFKDFSHESEELPLTIAVWNGGTKTIQPHVEWIRKTCSSGSAVMVLDTSGVGALMPNPLNANGNFEFYGAIHKLSTDLFWLNDSMAALRTYDVLRAIELAKEIPLINQERIRLYANGRQGLYARLAKSLEGEVEEIDVVDGMGSMAEWIKSRHYDSYNIISVIFPCMLKYFDLPELSSLQSSGS